MAEQAQDMAVSEDVIVTSLDVEDHPQFMDHEAVYKIHSAAHDITAFVGVHNTVLGPGLGGIRFKHYASEDEAIGDVLRLSEAMTWKNSAGALGHGGGKSVIMAPAGQKTPDETALQAMAHGLNKINKDKPMYFGAQDMNFGEGPVDYIASLSPWMKGQSSGSEEIVGGNPSPLTAIGVFECIKIAAANTLGKDSLEGARVSLQGLGSVGADLARHLYKEGAVLIGTDMNAEIFEKLAGEGVQVEKVGLDDIYDAPADIFAPNAIGGTINNDTIARLQNAGVQIVCGAANNQQEDQAGGAESKKMHEIGMLYCPDYIVNAGGVIWVAKVGEDAREVHEDIRSGVPRRFERVLKEYDPNGSDDMATIAARHARKRVEEHQNA